jgi:hypothetical protein
MRVYDQGPGRRDGGTGQSAMLRFIEGVFWIILVVFIILVILNIPGIR